jgi:hypothetical protein
MRSVRFWFFEERALDVFREERGARKLITPGVEKSMLIFERKKVPVKYDLSKEGNMLGSWRTDGIPFSRLLLLRETSFWSFIFFWEVFLSCLRFRAQFQVKVL